LLDDAEAALDFGEFVGVEDADVLVCAGVGDGAGDVLSVEGAVVVDGGIVFHHEGVDGA